MYCGLNETETSSEQTFGFTDNQWKDILQKVRNSVLNSIMLSELSFRRETEHYPVSPSNFEIFF